MPRARRTTVAAIVVALALVGLIASHVSDGWRNRSARATDTSTVRAPSADRAQVSASIEGHVYDQRQRTVAGARVCAQGHESEFPFRGFRLPLCVLSDPNGFYTILGLDPAEYEVTASARWKRPGAYKPNRISVAPGERLNAIDLVLADGGTELRGTVVDITGGPIAGAVVQAGPRTRYVAMTVTDEAGQFSLWVAPGDVRVHADAEGYVGNTEYGTTDIASELVLTPASSISGVVIDAVTKAPMPSIGVALGTSWYGGPGDITDEQGRFRIDPLLPGRYLVVARGDHRFGASDGSILVGLAQDVSNIVIRVAPAARVSATVNLGTAPPRPCARPYLTLTTSRTMDSVLGDQLFGVGTNGNVHVDGVLPGTYKASASCDDDSDDTEQSIEVGVDDVTDLRFETHSRAIIRGYVRTRDGLAVADARVRSNNYETSTDATGHYELTGLVPGHHPIAVSSPLGATSEAVSVDVPVGAAVVEHDVVLDAASRIAGWVGDTDGRDLAGINIAVQSSAEVPNAVAHFTTSRNDGTFEVFGLAAGRYTVTLDEQDANIVLIGLPPEVDVRPPASASVRLLLEARAQSISGAVVDADGAPITDAFVVAARERDGKSPLEDSRSNESSLRAVTDNTGRFIVGHLAAGDYTVRAMRKGGGEAFVKHVHTGASVRLQLNKTGSIAGTVRSTAVPLHDIRVYGEQVGTGLVRDERFFHGGGHYILGDLPAGDYVVVASVRGYRMTARVTLADGEQRAGVDLDLDAGTTLTGRMVDLRTRRPLAGIHVTAVPSGLRFDDEISVERVITDDSGQFVFRRIPRGLVVLHARSDGDLAETRWLREISGPNVDLGDVAMANRGVESGARGTLGIAWKEYDSNFPSDRRQLEVASVVPPAQGKLVVGDVITSVNGIDVTGTNRVAGYNLFDVAPGTSLRLGLLRGETVTVTAAGH